MNENEVTIHPDTARIGQVKNGKLLALKCMYRAQNCSLYCPKCRINTNPSATIRAGKGKTTSNYLTTCAGNFPIGGKE